MVFDQLHPSNFVETNSGNDAPTACFGPRNIRNQPSREAPGVLLQQKYITETDPELSVDFNLPFRNSIRQVEMLRLMYDKLDEDQKKVINGKISSITEGKVILGPIAEYDNNDTIKYEAHGNGLYGLNKNGDYIGDGIMGSDGIIIGKGSEKEKQNENGSQKMITMYDPSTKSFITEPIGIVGILLMIMCFFIIFNASRQR